MHHIGGLDVYFGNHKIETLVNLYKKMLERHILKRPFFLNLIDKALNPLMGKKLFNVF